MKDKKPSKTFLVLGYVDSGSGSLTFPEDFDFVGAYTDKDEAQEHVDLLNRKNGTKDPYGDDEDEDDGCSDEMVYTVWDVKTMKKAPKKV